MPSRIVHRLCGYHDCGLSLGISWSICAKSVIKLDNWDFLNVGVLSSLVSVCAFFASTQISHNDRAMRQLVLFSLCCCWLVWCCKLCWCCFVRLVHVSFVFIIWSGVKQCTQDKVVTAKTVRCRVRMCAIPPTPPCTPAPQENSFLQRHIKSMLVSGLLHAFLWDQTRHLESVFWKKLLRWQINIVQARLVGTREREQECQALTHDTHIHTVNSLTNAAMVSST